VIRDHSRGEKGKQRCRGWAASFERPMERKGRDRKRRGLEGHCFSESPYLPTISPPGKKRGGGEKKKGTPGMRVRGVANGNPQCCTMSEGRRKKETGREKKGWVHLLPVPTISGREEGDGKGKGKKGESRLKRHHAIFLLLLVTRARERKICDMGKGNSRSQKFFPLLFALGRGGGEGEKVQAHKEGKRKRGGGPAHIAENHRRLFGKLSRRAAGGGREKEGLGEGKGAGKRERTSSICSSIHLPRSLPVEKEKGKVIKKKGSGNDHGHADPSQMNQAHSGIAKTRTARKKASSSMPSRSSMSSRPSDRKMGEGGGGKEKREGGKGE